ncbi:F0F1 ATP synthase subunit gamma [Pseudorhodoferax sp.]|uniref:F0F1 ATP synthase subunit gamma n=1 Tax=Pseudorhodoferax sp. TaxID=1993553 RepID=UPI0039E652E8
MAERLGDVEARIGSIRQLSAVITAMRGIAAARLREAQARLEGVRAYAQTVGAGIAQALALLPDGLPDTGRPSQRHHLLIALCAEQGFAGGFDTRVLDAVAARRDAGRSELILVGDRGAMAAAERGLAPQSLVPMAAHVDEVPALADRLVGRLLDHAQAHEALEVTLVHGVPSPAGGAQVVHSRVLPFDYARFPPANRALPPLVTLPPARLLEQLTQEYLFAQLCEALLLSHAAENEARMRAMVAARDNVERKLGELGGRARLLRQEAITDEVIELAAGAQAQ